MPPASLSTFDVIKPGPTTARKTASRRRSERVRTLNCRLRLVSREKVSVNVTQVFICHCVLALFAEPYSAFPPQTKSIPRLQREPDSPGSTVIDLGAV